MRFDIIAYNAKTGHTVYKVFYNELDAVLYDWEMRMIGYTTKVCKN